MNLSKFNPVNLVYVFYQTHDQRQDAKVRVGRLVLQSRKIFFEYDPAFIASGLQLSPFHLPLRPGVQIDRESTFGGLFGVFNDSLPDGWGHLLLNRALAKHRVNPGDLSLLDRLCFVGDQGMGALVYEPEMVGMPLLPGLSLDQIFQEIRLFQNHEENRYVEDLLMLGGSSAGARPKVLMRIDDQGWLIKFPSTSDPKDIGAIEYAYHLMAKDAGLDVPIAKLFASRHGAGFFGSHRFDRCGSKRIHMHTVSGLLHVDHRVPSLDYEQVMKATLHLTHHMGECEKQYRQCVFNVFSHNRDDHAKNFSFLMDEDGRWRVSPAYDLVFSSGPAGEHCSMVMGEGQDPKISDLLALAKVSGIKPSRASQIIEEVRTAVVQWPQLAEKAGVSDVSMQAIQHVLFKKSNSLP